jgi:hypothetical protein
MLGFLCFFLEEWILSGGPVGWTVKASTLRTLSRCCQEAGKHIRAHAKRREKNEKLQVRSQKTSSMTATLTATLVFDVMIPTTAMIVVTIHAGNMQWSVATSMAHVPVVVSSIALVSHSFQFLEFIVGYKVHAIDGAGRDSLFDIGSVALLKGSSSSIF